MAPVPATVVVRCCDGIADLDCLSWHGLVCCRALRHNLSDPATSASSACRSAASGDRPEAASRYGAKAGGEPGELLPAGLPAVCNHFRRPQLPQALKVVAKLQAKYPKVPTRIVFSGEPTWPNAKVYSLSKMIASSSDKFLVISDSDVVVRPDFLRNVIPPLLNPKVGLVTCLYEGIPARGFWSQLEALGMSVEMPSGVLVAEMVDGIKFALGAVMAVRQDAIEAIGGIRETAYFYSDDFVLGNRIAETGFEVVLSHYKKVGHVLRAARCEGPSAINCAG